MMCPGDTQEDIARSIAELLRHLRDRRRGFRRYDEDDLSWLERLETRQSHVRNERSHE